MTLTVGSRRHISLCQHGTGTELSKIQIYIYSTIYATRYMLHFENWDIFLFLKMFNCNARITLIFLWNWDYHLMHSSSFSLAGYISALCNARFSKFAFWLQLISVYDYNRHRLIRRKLNADNPVAIRQEEVWSQHIWDELVTNPLPEFYAPLIRASSFVCVFI